MAGSPLAVTSLGAVGGARGTAAGGLRILVEFVTQFNSEELNQVRGDLAKLASQQQNAEQSLTDRVRERDELQTKIERGNKIILAQSRAQDQAYRDEFRTGIARVKELDVELDQIANKSRITDADKRRRGQLQVEQEGILLRLQKNAKDNSIRLDVGALRAGAKVLQSKRQEAEANHRILNAKERIHNISVQQIALEERQTALTKVRSEFGPKLAGLALGAIGGIFGGALFGVGFEAAQALIDKFSDSLKDIIDPARHAREALADVGKEVNDLASQESLTRLEAAQKILSNLGGFGEAQIGGAIKNPITAELLAQAGALQSVKDKAAEFAKLASVANNIDTLRAETIKEVTKQLLVQDESFQQLRRQFATERGLTIDLDNLQAAVPLLDALAGKGDANAANLLRMIKAAEAFTVSLFGVEEAADNAEEATQALADVRLDRLNSQIQDASNLLQDLAERVRDVKIDRINERLDGQLASLDAIQSAREAGIKGSADARINTLQDQLSGIKVIDSARTKGLQQALDALSDVGPSRQTQALAAAIEHLNAAEERRGYLQSLNEIRDNRRLAVLEHELRLRKTAINISNYSGPARLIAIDAEIDRLNRQAAAQEKINALLDLQYRASQRLRREEGETIQDFLDRRSQANRALLLEQAKLAGNSRVDSLTKLRENTEFNIKLKEFEAQRLELIRQHDLEAHQQSLQDQLRASEEADQRRIEAQRETLGALLEASKAADQAAADAKRKSLQDEIDTVRDNADKAIEQSRRENEAKKVAAKAAAEVLINAAKKTADESIAAAKKSAELATFWVNKGEQDKIKLAIEGAKTLQDLSLVSGGLAGSSLAYAQLKASIEALGLPDYLTSSVLANADAMRSVYLARLASFNSVSTQPKGPQGYADGGVFPLRNSMNFGSNMRVGERGTELGVILSNRVTKALRDSNSGLSIGSITYQTTEDPYMADYRLRSTIREVVREELN